MLVYFSFSYDADVYDDISVSRIRDQARTLLKLLSAQRSGISQEIAIVFIAHGLGGLVVKKVKPDTKIPLPD